MGIFKSLFGKKDIEKTVYAPLDSNEDSIENYDSLESDVENIDEIEDTEENISNTQILRYLDTLKKSNRLLDVLVSFKSSRDVNIVVVAADDALQKVKIQLESDLYLKRELNVANVNRINNKILVLTHDECTFKIAIITKQEFDEHYSKK